MGEMAEKSMAEYQLLDSAAQSIEILKALNIRDRDLLQEEANGRKKEEAPGVLKAIKYRVYPQEIQKTRDEWRDLRERGCPIRCVEDCMPRINEAAYLDHPASPYNIVFELNDMECVMSKVRATAMQLQTDNPDGHWAIELLNFYSDGWLVYLADVYSTFLDYWLECCFDEKKKAAKQRAEVARKIVEEVEKEREQMSAFRWHY